LAIVVRLRYARSGSCGEIFSQLGIRKKVAVLSLPCEFRPHFFELSTSFFCLVGLPSEFLDIKAVLLNLNFEAMERSSGFQ
jgi:hypothetical protein